MGQALEWFGMDGGLDILRTRAKPGCVQVEVQAYEGAPVLTRTRLVDRDANFHDWHTVTLADAVYASALFSTGDYYATERATMESLL